jgi:hypothetical protein
MPIARVQLPDGRIARLQVPEGTSPDDVESFVASQFGSPKIFEEETVVSKPEEIETTVGGQVKEALKGLVPGAVGLGETAITGAAALLPEEQEQAVRRAVSSVVDPVREAFAPEAGYEETTGRKLGEAIGSTLPFFPLGALGAAGRVAATGLGVGAGAGEARLRAEEEGATEGERGLATALGAPVGALEALPPVRVLRRLGFGDEALQEVAGFVPALRRVATAGSEEALQEASSQVLQNLIAKGVYDPEAAALGGVGEAAALGGGAGAVISAIMELAIGRRSRGAAPAEEEPPVEEEPELLALPAPEKRLALPGPKKLLALPSPRIVGYEIDSQGNVVRGITEDEAKAKEAEFAELRAQSRFLPMEQMDLGLEGGIAQPDMFLEEPTEPGKGMYIPAEDLLSEFKPRSKLYREAARDLGIRLDKKGNIKPNQFVFAPPEAGVAPGQERFDFDYEAQQELPLTTQAGLEGQGDLFAEVPIPRGGPTPTVPTREEIQPAEERVPEEQEAFFFSSAPIDQLPPKQRVLRVMTESDTRKTVQNLRGRTGLPDTELKTALAELRDEGVISYKPGKFEWELTPEGVESVRTDQRAKPARTGRGAALPVSRPRSRKPGATGTGPGGVAGVGGVPPQADAGETEVEAPLEAPPLTAEQKKARYDLIRRYFQRLSSRKAIDERNAKVTELRTQAADAFEKGAISDTTYNSITNELKKPVPNLGFVTNKLAARAKAAPKKEAPVAAKPAPAPVQPAPAVGLREDATDEDIAAFYKKTGGSKAPPSVKKERGVSLTKLDREAEDAADAFLRQAEEKAAPAPTPAAPAPKVHPEWATKFESQTKGKIVFSEGDLALLTGSSVGSGQTVYIGIKKDKGGKVADIESSFVTSFSPEEKQRLIQAKKQIIAEDKAKFEKNPQGPFTGTTSNVVASDGVNPNYANFLRSLMKSMGLGDIRVFLFHPEDIRDNKDKYKLYGTYSSALSAGIEALEDGSLRPYGPDFKDFYISVKPGMSEGRTVEVITHELGHLIERVAFNNAPKDVKAAIMAEYNEWLGSAKKKSGSDLIYALRNRETAEAQAAGKTPETKLAKENSYWRSFTEWFADNTSKWATTSEKPVGIVEKFFADLAKKLRELVSKLTGNRFVPAKSVKDFLDAMGPGSADAWKNAKGPLNGSPFDSAARYSMSPTEQRANDRDFINTVGKIPTSGEPPTRSNMEAARNAASNVTPQLRQSMFSFMTLHQLDQMYGKYIKTGLKRMWDSLNAEGVALRKREDELMETVEKGQKVMEKYSPAERTRIFNMMLDTTVEQVEVLDLVDKSRGIEWKAKKDHPLYREFMALAKKDPAVLELYKDLRLAYLDYALGIEKVMQQYLTPTEWQKIQLEINKRRLPVYLPLFRTGDYKLTYTDKSGQYVSRLFGSPRERDMAAEEARRAGATDIDPTVRENFNVEKIPPTSFFGEVMGTLAKNGVSKDVQRQVFETYMDYLPNNSVLQLSRKREATAGYEPDVLQAFANVGSSYARRLTNMEFAPRIAADQEQFKIELAEKVGDGSISADVAADLNGTVESQLKYFNNPNLNNWASKLGYFSYTMYLGANISTAIVNVLDIPTVTLSKLGGTFGFAKSSAALTNAAKLFFAKQKPAEIQQVIDRGLDSGVVREQRLRDIAEFKNLDSKYARMKAGVDRVVNWAFAKSDMFNRETALIAAYQLSKAKRGKVADGEFDPEAFNDAKRSVYDIYGSSFPKAGPPIMQNGLARTALTFKQFAINRMLLLTNAIREAGKGESKEVRDAARKELMGYFGTAYVFAGAQGMPLVGAGMTLVSALNGIFGDDDEPYDPEFALREAIGLFNYKGPVNYLTGVDIASRTGWTGMFWREDPKRMAEVGPVTYTMEQFLGPAYSYAVGVPRAFDYMENGQYGRAFEQVAPRAIGNIHKSIRYATDGAKTANGIPLVEDVGAYNQFMQLFGFRPSDVAEAGEEAGAAKRMEGKIFERRNGIIERAALAQLSGDADGFREAVLEAANFNQKNPGKPISLATLQRAIKRRQDKIVQSVNGVTVDRKLAMQIYGDLGIDPMQ